MRIFVTGASGWIGSATVAELLSSGHEVLGLARSGGSADRIAALGAEVHRGSLDDLDSLRAGAEATEGIVHLGYNHDFSLMAEAAQTDRQAIDTFGDVLAGTDRPLVIASGVAGLASGRISTEQDEPDPTAHPRVASARAALALASRGVRSAVVRFAPTVHGPGDPGFVSVLVGIARDKGVSAHIGDGENRWPAVHRLDAADLVRRVVDNAPAGSVWHAVAEEGVTTRTIAEAIGRGLDLPVQSIPADQAAEHFGWLAQFFSGDYPSSSRLTLDTLHWEPSHPSLLADLDAGHYFDAAVSSIR